MKIILAITAASGAIYARQIASLLLASSRVEELAIILSHSAARVMEHEGESLPDDPRITYYDNNELFAPMASGSSQYEAMIVAPCSMGTIARIANGISESLITRAADVMLKERRHLLLLARETPLSLIHLRNMVTLTEAGAIILPAAPSFYMKPQNINDLALSISSRAVNMIGIHGNVAEWRGEF